MHSLDRVRQACYSLFADKLEQDQCDELALVYIRCRNAFWPEPPVKKVDMSGTSSEELWADFEDRRCIPHEIFNRAAEQMTGTRMPHGTCWGCYVQMKDELYDRFEE